MIKLAEQPVIKTFDISRLETYLDCRRKFRLRYVENWDLKSARALAAEYGTAVHAFLNIWHGTGSWDESWLAFLKSWEKAGGDSETDATRTQAHAEWFLRRYTEKYPPGSERFRVLLAEEPFEIEMPGGFIFQGRIDKIIQAPGEAPMVMDHKTTSQLGYSTMLRYHPNLQMLGYVWAARLLIDRACYAAMVDLVSTARNASKSIDDCFARRVVSFTDDEIDEFPKILLGLAEEINRAAEQGQWIPNFGQCTAYGECPYRRLCTQPNELWQGILAADFEERPWSPVQEGTKISLRGKYEGT